MATAWRSHARWGQPGLIVDRLRRQVGQMLRVGPGQYLNSTTVDGTVVASGNVSLT